MRPCKGQRKKVAPATWAYGLILAVFLTAVAPTWAEETAGTLFQAGLYKEQIHGELDAAIALYQRIVEEFPAERSLAAKALFHIGLCREKLDQKEALSAYQKLLDKYPEQQQVVVVARERITEISKALKKPVLVAGPESSSAMVLRKIDWDWTAFTNISPDGRYMSDFGRGNLVISDLANGDQWFIPTDDWDHALDSAISPDSQKVAYLCGNSESSALYVANLDGSNRRLLCDGTYAMPRAWSADGSRILAIVLGKPNQMVWVSASDGSIQPIKDMGKAQPQKLDVSPDGRFIAYNLPRSLDASEHDVFLYDIAEDREIRLTEAPADHLLLGWTPGGESIFFLGDRTGSWDAWLLDVQNGKPSGIPRMVKPHIGKVWPVGFGAKGEYYFGVSSGRRSVYTASFDLDTGTISGMIAPIEENTGRENNPIWSPDGKYLAYWHGRSIRIRSLDTGQEREITPKGGALGWWDWAPDGRSFVVTEFRGQQRAIYRVDAYDGEQTELIRNENVRFTAAQWLPDGKRLLYRCFRSVVDPGIPRTVSLVIRDMATGCERTLVRAERPNSILNFALSPDGRHVVATIIGPTGGVKLISTDDGRTRELLGRDWAVKIRGWAGVFWSPDCTSIFLLLPLDVQPQQRGTELWRIAAEGGEPERLQTWENLRLQSLRINPNGQQAALWIMEGLTQLWVLENFLPQTEPGGAVRESPDGNER